MKRLSFEEIIELLEKSYWLSINDINTFIVFAQKNRFKQRWVSAINAKYRTEPVEQLESDTQCSMIADMISCFIDWEKSSDDNWAYINTQWQEYWPEHR